MQCVVTCLKSSSLAPPHTSGFYGYRFTTPGVYYYSSGYIDEANVKLLQGVVIVKPREDTSSRVSVRVGGMEARHVTGGEYVDGEDGFNQELHSPVNVKEMILDDLLLDQWIFLQQSL